MQSYSPFMAVHVDPVPALITDPDSFPNAHNRYNPLPNMIRIPLCLFEKILIYVVQHIP